uniref:Oligosaccharyltransferase complex subunit n=1 Tax=Petromyzon marinus TaxID=7757 RepID=S4RFU3_PETMA
ITSVMTMVGQVIEWPRVRIKKPGWLVIPSATTAFIATMIGYFVLVSGVIYDIIHEPPSIGSRIDAHGHQRPIVFKANSLHSQYILEGLAAGMLFCVGGLGLLLMLAAEKPSLSRLHRYLCLSLGGACMLGGFLASRAFIHIKFPSFLLS